MIGEDTGLGDDLLPYKTLHKYKEAVKHRRVGGRRYHIDLSHERIIAGINIGLIGFVADHTVVVLLRGIAYLQDINLGGEGGDHSVVLILVFLHPLVHRNLLGYT